jgi:hypothetical protein
VPLSSIPLRFDSPISGGESGSTNLVWVVTSGHSIRWSVTRLHKVGLDAAVSRAVTRPPSRAVFHRKPCGVVLDPNGVARTSDATQTVRRQIQALARLWIGFGRRVIGFFAQQRERDLVSEPADSAIAGDLCARWTGMQSSNSKAAPAMSAGRRTN